MIARLIRIRPMGLAIVAATTMLSCERAPSGPLTVPLLELASSPSIDEGCDVFEVVVRGPRATAVPVGGDGCGTLTVVIDGTPIADPTANTVRLPVAIHNAGAHEAVAPARLFAPAEGLVLVHPRDLPPFEEPVVRPPSSTSGSIIWVRSADEILADPSIGAGEVAVWSYDAVLGGSGSEPVLPPGARTASRLIEIGTRPGVHTFRVALHARATRAAPTSFAQPPDSIPSAIYAATNVTESSPDLPGAFLKNIVLVTFAEDASEAQRGAAIRGVSGTVVGGVRFADGDGVYVVQVPDDGSGSGALAAADQLATLPQVDAASPEMLGDEAVDYLRPRDDPTHPEWHLDPDSAAGVNWALERIAAPMAWGCSVGNRETSVAVLDYYFTDIPDLSPNVTYHEYSFLRPSSRHGTAVAAILGARGNNRLRMTGVMWEAGLRLYRRDPQWFQQPGLWFQQRRAPQTTLVDLALMTQAAEAGARVINLSGGMRNEPPALGTAADTLRSARRIRYVVVQMAAEIRRLERMGRRPLFVFSAGNANPAQPLSAYWNTYPALADSFPQRILVVASTERNDALRTDSRIGNLVNIAAPGTEVLSMTQDGDLAPLNATSAAAPLVSGVAGLLFAFDPSLTAEPVHDLILRGAAAGGRRTPVSNYPIVNAHESLKLAAQRPGAPLCGNRVWATNGQIIVQRGGARSPADREVIATTGPTAMNLSVAHGGHRIEFVRNTPSGDIYFAVEHRDGMWQPPMQIPAFGWPGPGVVNRTIHPAGSAQSSHWFSHDGDRSLDASAFLVEEAPEFPLTLYQWSEDAGFQVARTSISTGLNGPDRICQSLRIQTDRYSEHCQTPLTVPGPERIDWATVAYPQMGDTALVILNRWRGDRRLAIVREQLYDVELDDTATFEVSKVSITWRPLRAEVYRIALSTLSGQTPQLLLTIPDSAVYWAAFSEDERATALAVGVGERLEYINYNASEVTVPPYDRVLGCAIEYRDPRLGRVQDANDRILAPDACPVYWLAPGPFAPSRVGRSLPLVASKQRVIPNYVTRGKQRSP